MRSFRLALAQVPLARLELAHTASEADALSTELQGRAREYSKVTGIWQTKKAIREECSVNSIQWIV